jgi:predicted Ser/Thr protein kinase
MRVDEERPTRAADPSPPDPFLGQVLGGCRIDEVLGRGGMGVVYKATQLSLNRPVAIKVLPEEVCGQPQFVERFKREVDVLSRLAHPNVVTVFERGEIDGRLYVIMEYVQGTSLREVIRKGPLPSAEALVIVRGVLAALEHAHGKGIIHRDIKPENVLVAPGGIVKVADFGLSRLMGPAEATRLTHTNILLGTYEYMAPEQREKAREADERADIYATGVVLYELLAGELPIGHFAALSRKRPKECDSRIDEIVERSLAKSPDDRYQRASEMGAAVSRVLSAAMAPEPPPAAEAPPRREEPRRKGHRDRQVGARPEVHIAARLTAEEEARVDRPKRGRKDDPAGGVGCVVFLVGLVFGLGLLKSVILAVAVMVLVRIFAGGAAPRWVGAVLAAIVVTGALVFLLLGVQTPAPTPPDALPELATVDWERLAREAVEEATEREGFHLVIAHWTAGRRPGFVEKLSANPKVVGWIAGELGVDAAVAGQFRLVSLGDQIILISPLRNDPLNAKADTAFRWLVLHAVGEAGGAVSMTASVSGARFKTDPPKGLGAEGAD